MTNVRNKLTQVRLQVDQQVHEQVDRQVREVLRANRTSK